MIPMNKLMLFGVAGLGACFGISEAFKYKVSGQIKEMKLYEEAMDLLRHHRGALYLLGEPITDSIAKYNSPGQEFGCNTEVKVSVSGPKENGILFFTLGSDEKQNNSLDTVQLQVGRDNNKRLVIKKSIKEESSGS